MLSPSMITKSKLTRRRKRSICSATRYCSCPPVPLSPMTANRTDWSASGKRRSRPSEDAFAFSQAVSSPDVIGDAPGAGGGASPRTKRPVARRNVSCHLRIFSLLLRRDRVGDEIDDNVGHGVIQDEVVAHNAVLQFFRK